MTTDATTQSADSEDWAQERDREELHSELRARVAALSSVYQSRRARWRAAATLYLNRELPADALDDGLDRLVDFSSKKPTNVIASCVETVHSHTAEIQPRPAFSTIEGSQKLQNRAKYATRVCREDFARFDYEEHISDAQLDALIGDAGVLRMGVRDGAPSLERVLPYRLLVDPAEYDREPTTYFYVYPSTARALKAEFPDPVDKNAIDDAGSIFTDVAKSGSKIHQVDVVEAVTLPLGPSDPGRKVVFTSAGILSARRYDYEWPPYLVIRWTRDPTSFWGQGLVEKLAGIQFDIDFKDAKIREHESLIAGKWFKDEEDGIDAESLDDMPAICTVSQGKRDPRYVNPPALSGETYASKDRSVQGAFQVSGVSQMAAQAEKPAGLDAAAAIRAYAAITSKRFRKWQETVQKAFLQVGRMWAEVVSKDPAIDRDKRIKVPVGRGLKMLTYADIALDPEHCSVRVEVTSFLGTTFASRLQEAQEFVRIGALPVQNMVRAAQTGDLEAEQYDMTASGELAQRRLEMMVETGRYLPPNPFFDLELHMNKATTFYQECELADVRADRLRLVVRYIQQCADLVAMAQGTYPGQAAPPQPGPEAGPPGPPPGTGGPPPDPQAMAAEAAMQAQAQAVQGDAGAQIASAAA